MPFLTDWRVIVAAVGVLAVAFYVMALRLERDHYKAEWVEERAAFLEFKNEVAAAGEKAKREAADKEADDKKRKDEADAQNAAATAGLAVSLKRLRDERDRARSDLLSAASAGTGDPDVACFDRPDAERALGGFIREIRDLADEGTKAVIDLDTAKRWVQGR